MTNEELVNSAIEALGPIVKVNENEPNLASYVIAARILRRLIHDVSSELTDEQNNCKYCHEPFKFIGNSDAGFRIDQYDETVGYYDASGMRFTDGYTDPEVQFDFCPMCGRKLGV